MKICLVKQEVYQDLYVCPNRTPPDELLKSSAMRVGPFGLFSRLDADFRIVREEVFPETQIYRRSLPHLADDLALMKNHTIRALPGMEFAEPGTEDTNGMFAESAAEVDWESYDVVIALNAAIPRRIVERHPRTLFAYMIGEANSFLDRPRFGYDCVLNQEGWGRAVDEKNWVVDFPYTFLGRDCLEEFGRRQFGGGDERGGICPEINMSEERPVRSIPEVLRPLSERFPIHLHRQNITENIAQLFRSRYFVKLGGRVTRGNGIVEAISAGCLALFRRDEVIHNNLLLERCAFETEGQLFGLIDALERDEWLYRECLEEQKQRVEMSYFRRPVEELERCLAWKRAGKSGRGSRWAGLRRRVRGAMRRIGIRPVV